MLDTGSSSSSASYLWKRSQRQRRWGGVNEVCSRCDAWCSWYYVHILLRLDCMQLKRQSVTLQKPQTLALPAHPCPVSMMIPITAGSPKREVFFAPVAPACLQVIVHNVEVKVDVCALLILLCSDSGLRIALRGVRQRSGGRVCPLSPTGYVLVLLNRVRRRRQAAGGQSRAWNHALWCL